jgi:membrane protease YdiL (CAAX protease family)
LDAIVDRPRREAALAVVAAWLAFMAGLLAGGEIEDPASFTFAAAGGAALVLAGFAAASRSRTRPGGLTAHPARLTVMSLAAGTALGLGNLAANWLIAEAHPVLRALLVRRFARIDAVEGLFVAPIVEEVAIRLFLMSVLAWGISRVTDRARLGFAIALVASALFFALLHLDRPMPEDPALANFYRAALVTKYTLAGMALGWVYWRWGLPYAIVCHAATNAAHMAAERALF